MSDLTESVLSGCVLDREALEPGTVGAMFALYARYFERSDRDTFESDLAEKDRVILIRSDDVLVGFSTVQARVENVGGRELAVLFSGDTIVDRRHWGSGVLERCWLRTAVEAHERLRRPLYWLLISGGYRTYRFLPVFFRQFWPRHEAPTPPAYQALLDTLSRRRFGDAYHDGVVRHDSAHLRDRVSPVSEARLRDPHVAHFVRANPGHARGDELACITRVETSNLTRAGLRVLRRIEP